MSNYGRKAYDVVAWTYGADYHCPSCAEKAYGDQGLAMGEARDGEGNLVHPVFLSDLGDIRYEVEHIEHEQWKGITCGTCREVFESE